MCTKTINPILTHVVNAINQLPYNSWKWFVIL